MGRLKPRCIIGRHRRRGIECRGDSEKNTPTEFLVGVKEYEEENKQVEEDDKKDQQQEQVDSPGVRLAVEILRFYKTGISPLLPPSCRFVPTCSVYATEAYTTYGVTKGTILTAWRLMRCNPWGGSGYDPVSWPPPGLPWLQH